MSNQRTLVATFLSIGFLCLGPSTGPSRGEVNTWSSQGPFGASMRALVIAPSDSNVLYGAGFGDRVYRSEDAGAVWLPTSLENSSLMALAVDPQVATTIYAGTSGEGVFKSFDGGASWSAANTGLTDLGVLSLAIDPLASSVVFAGTQSGAVFKSTDGGINWAETGNDSSVGPVLDLVVDPQATSTLYAGGISGVQKTTDSGATWQLRVFGATLSLVVDPTDSQILYRGSQTVFQTAAIDRSLDGGQTWQEVESGTLLGLGDVVALGVDPAQSNHVYAALSRGGLAKSTDGGDSWTNSSEGLNRWAHDLVLDPATPSTVYVASEGHGVFKSLDMGATWNPSNVGLQGAWIKSIFAPSESSMPVYVGLSHGGGFAKGPFDEEWMEVGETLRGLNLQGLAADAEDSSSLYAMDSFTGLWRSTDAGGTWKLNQGNTSEFPEFFSALDPHPSAPGLLYAAGTRLIRRSFDGGNNWILRGVTGVETYALAVSPSDPAVAYGMGRPQLSSATSVFRTLDHGDSWRVQAFLPPVSTFVLAVDALDPMTVYRSAGVGLEKTTDGGSTWLASGLTDSIVTAIWCHSLNSSLVYAGTSEDGVFESLDGGASWQPLNSGLTNLHVSSLEGRAGSALTLYVGTKGRGVFEMPRVFPIFADGFESGDTSAWSLTFP